MATSAAPQLFCRMDNRRARGFSSECDSLWSRASHLDALASPRHGFPCSPLEITTTQLLPPCLGWVIVLSAIRMSSVVILGAEPAEFASIYTGYYINKP
jgi:hypothetical protein